MNEFGEIYRGASGAAERGSASVLATVVRVSGSAYRRPGARMLFFEDRPPTGLVSGGCLEADLAERARGVLATGASHTVVYDMRSPDDIVWGLGLGCNGEVRVLLERLEPAGPPDWMRLLERLSRERRAGCVVTVFDGRGTLASAVGERLCLSEDGAIESTVGDAGLRRAAREIAQRCVDGGRSEVRSFELGQASAEAFVEYVPPDVALLVFGAGGDAIPLVRLAAQLGWRTTVADDRPALLAPERFPEAEAVVPVRFDALDRSGFVIDAATPVVVMTHHFLHDLELLHFLLPTPAPYLGILGPRQRTENLLRQLAERGAPTAGDRLRRLYGPVGLDIGSETPEEIALATLAEIRAVMAGRAGGSLRDRSGPLHEPAP